MMIRFSDYLYALVPSVCLAVPFALFAQWVPDVEFLHGLERLGIVGFLAAGILFFVMERRSFIDQSVRKLALLERRISNLEANVSSGNDKVVSLLGQQLDALREIKEAQAENFARMWQLTLDKLQISNTTPDHATNRLSSSEKDVFRPRQGQKQG